MAFALIVGFFATFVRLFYKVLPSRPATILDVEFKETHRGRMYYYSFNVVFIVGETKMARLYNQSSAFPLHSELSKLKGLSISCYYLPLLNMPAVFDHKLFLAPSWVFVVTTTVLTLVLFVITL